MIVLRTPKGWTGPKEVDGHKVEGFWRAHQVPVTDPSANPTNLEIVENWMRSYRPEELFDEHGSPVAELQGTGARGRPADQRQSARERRPAYQAAEPARLPRLCGCHVEPRPHYSSPTATLAKFLARCDARAT